MKKFLFTLATLCGVWAGTHSIQTNCAAAQTGLVTTTIIPLTNQVPFTNTLVIPTNLSTLQLTDVVTRLLALQTNVEETLPLLDLIQSNAVVVSIMPTNHPLASVDPLTLNPSEALTPTGAASGAARPQTSLAVKIGTNTFGIDAATLQGLFVLRVNLQRSLAILQQLNGTTPVPPTNSNLSPLPPPITSLQPPPLSNLPPPVTTFAPPPLTNALAIPPTNALPTTMSNPAAF